MKKRGFKFFGPTICYAFLQATGFVNDHLEGCRCKAPDRPLPDRRAEADSRRTSRRLRRQPMNRPYTKPQVIYNHIQETC